MSMQFQDEIVETRTWRSGVEIIARVNWSHVARVRSALGLAGDEVGRNDFGRLLQRRPLTLLGDTGLRAAGTRAA